MKKQVLVIHGGDAFSTYEDYIKFLKEFTIDSLDYFNGMGWKSSLQKELGEEFEVICPRMPNNMNARYEEWKIWFEKITPFLMDGVTLVGHSLGGIFLAKYLSKNIFPLSVSGLHLVSAPFDDETDEPLMDFSLDVSMENISKQISNVFLYHSKDDQVVPFGELEKYKKEIPLAKVFVFDNRGHINQQIFPELVENINNKNS